MMNGNNFVSGIWEKYDRYNNFENRDEFFNRHLYKNTDYLRSVRTFLSFVFICMTMVSMVYAGSIVYKKINQKASKRKSEGIIEYNEYYGDMSLSNGRMYKKIYTYEEYVLAKEKYGNIVEMTKEEFKDNFVILIVLEKYSDSKTYIDTINVDTNSLYINFKKYSAIEKIEVDNNVLSGKIEINDDRENLIIDLILDESIKPYSDKYKSIERIPLDYTEQNAKEDNCCVIKNFEIISEDKNALENFIKDTQSGKEEFIRIVIVYEDGIIIRDIEYKDKKYIICNDVRRLENNNSFSNISYMVGSKIQKNGIRFSKDEEYLAYRYEIILDKEVEDPNQNNVFVMCTINK